MIGLERFSLFKSLAKKFLANKKNIILKGKRKEKKRELCKKQILFLFFFSNEKI